MNNTELTRNERDMLNHWMMFGSDGYPIRKLGRKWQWTEAGGIQGSPVLYATKRDAFAAFENYISSLIDRRAGRA